MSLLSIVQDAMEQCSLTRPSIVFASSDDLVRQFLAFSKVAGDYEMDFGNWRAQKVLGQFTGDGSSTDFELPADFEEFMPGYPMWLDRTPSVPLRRVTDEEMLAAKIAQTAPLRPIWRMFGDTIEMYPAPETTETIKMEYRSRYWITDESGATRQARWLADTDISTIPERLITASTVWRWKQSKGLPYDEDFRFWNMMRDRLMSKQQANTPIRVGRRNLHPGLATGVYGDVPEITP